MEQTTDILRRLGITRNYRGAQHLRAAIECVKENEEHLLLICDLYRLIAFRAGCSAVSVERSMRTAILRAWDKNRPLLCKIAGYPLTAPPTISEFIEMVAYYTQKYELSVVSR